MINSHWTTSSPESVDLRFFWLFFCFLSDAESTDSGLRTFFSSIGSLGADVTGV
jgi:hypothetical protein